MTGFNKYLFFILLAAILLCTAGIIYLALTPGPSDKFTEFYLLNADGKAAGYPAEVRAGQPVSIIVGIVNHEMAPHTYKVLVTENGTPVASLQAGMLSDNQKFEKKMDILPLGKSGNVKLEFSLFMNDAEKPHIKDPLVLNLRVIP